MTTMSPSMKDKLRKNLKTFATSNLNNTSNKIFQTSLPPDRKKRAHKMTQEINRRYSQAREQPKTASVKPYEGMIMPYNRDRNDEIALFVNNASKPLVDEGRRFRN